MPIRWRLTLWFSILLCITIVLSGMVIHTLLQRSLGNEIDDNLRVYSARVHGTLNPDEIPEPLDYEVIHASLPPVNEFALPGVYVQLVDGYGQIVVKSDNLGEQELPLDATVIETRLAGGPVLETVSADDEARVRVMSSPLFLHDETLLLQVGRSLENMDATMSQVRWAILGGVLLTLVLAGVSGWMLVRRALSPVEQITQTAQSIQSGSDLSRRVGYSGPSDEIGRLATTFDHMIERLDRVFEAQKHFVSDASHDLRGPLTVFRGNIGLLKRNLGEEDRSESLRAMEVEAQRMEGMVNDLLLLAEVESGRPGNQEKTSLKDIVAEGLDTARQAAGSRRIVIDRLDDLWVSGDPAKLRRMLANLVDNAIKYTPETGTITVSMIRDGECARLEVADTGVGIAGEHIRHVFDRFYRAEKARSRGEGGTGLGLAIVKGIAEQHGGKVAVESEPGEGSTFTVWLRL